MQRPPSPPFSSSELPPRAPGGSSLLSLPKAKPKLLKKKKSSRPPKAPTALQDPAPELTVVSDDLSNSFDYGVEFSIDASSTSSGSMHGYSYDDNSEEEKKTIEDEHRKGIFGSGGSKKRISASDVASVGNASDTMVNVSSRMCSGRELHETAKLALNQADYIKALSLFEAILSAQVQRFGPCHPSVAAAIHNVGVCRQRMLQHDIAEDLFVQAVQIREQTLGLQHLEVAASLSKLGAARIALKKFDEAFADLRQACSIARHNLGNDHKTVAQISSHLACLYFEAGELLAAQATFEDALEIYRRVWRDQVDRDACMMQLTDTLCNIGSIQNRRKRFTDAIGSFSEALDLQRGVLGHDHPRIISTLDNLGFNYSKNRQFDQALQCYKNMMRAQVSSGGSFTFECFETFQKQILMYERLKRLPQAVEEAKEVLKMQQKLNVEDKLVSDTQAVMESLKKQIKKKKSVL